MSHYLTINFTTPKISEYLFRYCPSQPDEDPPAFALQIAASPIESRIKPNRIANLAHLLYCSPTEQPEPKERYLKILLETRQLSEAIDFLEKQGVRRESTVKIFKKLQNTSKVGGVA